MLQRSRVEDDQRILASKGRCNKCHLSADPNVGYVCVKGRGAVQPDILIVGEAPGYDESRAGEAFVGPAAKHGIKIIESLGIDLDTVRFSNTTRCFPHDKQMKPRTPNYEKETVHCIDYLYEEIDMTRPKVIIALGAYPTKVLLDKTGITKLAGTVHSITVKGKPYPVVPCPHFSADLRSGGRYTEAITRALQTAKAVVSEEEVPVASYVLNTTQEAVSFLKNLLKRHEEGKLPCIAYDMEYDVLVNQEGLTRGEASRKSNISLYDPERKIVAVSFATNSKEGYCIPLFVNESQVNFEAVLPYLQKVVTTIPVIAHNWLKAEGAWTTEKFGVKPNLFFDTMLASYCLYMKTRSHGLKVLASQLLQWPDWSQKLDVYLKSLPSEERSYKNVPLDILGKYSAIDPIATYALYELFAPAIENEGLTFALDMLHQASRDFLDIELRGAFVDQDFHAKLLEEYPKKAGEILAQLKETPAVKELEASRTALYRVLHPKGQQMDEFNPTSPQHLASLLYGEFHFPLPPLEGARYFTSHDPIAQYAMSVPIGDAANFIGEEVWVSSKDEQGQHWAERNTIQDATPVTTILKTPLRFHHRPPVSITVGKRSMDEETVLGALRQTMCDDTAEDCERCGGTGITSRWKDIHDFLSGLRTYKKITKLMSSYITPLTEHIVPGTNRIVFSYLLHATDTGRLVATNYPMQTLPAGTDVRRLFVSEWKDQGGLILSLDQSQLELRVLTSESLDPKFLETYLWCRKCERIGKIEEYGWCSTCGQRLGEDMHMITALELYDCRKEDVSKDMRRNAKAINFGIAYGMGPRRLSDDTGMSIQDARDRIDRFFDRFEGIATWIADRHSEFDQYGYVRSKLGRKIYADGWKSPDKMLLSRGRRQAQNGPIQSFASDLTLIGMSIAKRDLLKAGLKSVPWEFTHDSVEFDIYPGELLSVLPIVTAAMERGVFEKIPPMAVPLLVEAELGVRWDGTVSLQKAEGNTLLLRGRKRFLDETLATLEKSYIVRTIVQAEEPAQAEADLLRRSTYKGDIGEPVIVTAQVELTNGK